MRKFSRWMPPAPDPRTGILDWLMFAGIVAGIGAAIVAWPKTMVFVGVVIGALVAVIVLLTVIMKPFHDRSLRRRAAERTNEDIGTFARGFDRRAANFDPWVVRASWDALEPYVSYSDGRLPLRLSDRVDEDLGIDPEELEDVVAEIATRTGRSQNRWAANPYYGRVTTVGDLVNFVACQPRT